MLFTGLGESFDPVLFGLSRTLNKASDWTYEVIFNAIQKETDRQGSTEWQTTALNTSFTGFSSRGGGQKGRSRGGKPKSVEVQEKPKGKEGEKETVVAKDGSRWTKGDMWCENNANHSTKGCIAAARKDQRKEWGQSQANVASLDPFDDIDSDRDKVFPPTLAIQPTIRRAGASNVVVEPEAITSILSSALLADRDNKLVLDSGATDTFVNGISFLTILAHVVEPSASVTTTSSTPPTLGPFTSSSITSLPPSSFQTLSSSLSLATTSSPPPASLVPTAPSPSTLLPAARSRQRLGMPSRFLESTDCMSCQVTRFQ
jgi:hypothetical protein